MAWAAIGISDSLITWKLKLAAAHVELVRVGRTPAELSREFNVIAQLITKWDGQADIDSTNPLPDLEGLRKVCTTSAPLARCETVTA